MSTKQMFGMTEEEVAQEYAHYRRLYLENDPDAWSRSMFAMSVLSDAQALLEYGRTDEANQLINKAKYHLGELHSAADPRNEL